MTRRTRIVLAVLMAEAAGTAATPRADEIRVLSAAAVQVPAEAVAQAFTARTGASVRFEFVTAGQVDRRLEAGDLADVVITSAERAPRIAPVVGRPRALGTVQIGVGVRAGAPRPDLSSVDGFTRSLQQVASLAYGDPAGGSTTGIHFAKVFAALPFTGAARPRVVLGANGLDVMQRVAQGEVDWGITQVSEILHVAPSLLAGPLPDPIQLSTTYVAVVRSTRSAMAQAFVEQLTGADGAARFRAAGFR